MYVWYTTCLHTFEQASSIQFIKNCSRFRDNIVIFNII